MTMIDLALEKHAGNKMRAAKELGVCVRTIRNKIKEFNMVKWFDAKTGIAPVRKRAIQ